MIWNLRSNSSRYALALWLATVLALFISFILQLEPAQWSAITVWIVFMQDPRMNYSKIIWWAFGTIVGATMAVLLIAGFNQAPELGLLALALWLSVCAATARLVNSYRSYGWVLAGYTCAIVSMSSVDHPDMVFQFAVTRVSCIFVGMASAILLIVLLLPKHEHWRQTVHHLEEHFRATLLQASRALDPDLTKPAQFTWRHMADRLSTLEHTLDITTAESADSRIHAPPARSLVATLFDLLAKAQAIEVHLARPHATPPGPQTKALLEHTGTLLTRFAAIIPSGKAKEQDLALTSNIIRLQNEINIARESLIGVGPADDISNRFVLDRLGEILDEFGRAVEDWSGLFGHWTAERPSNLAVHKDYPSAILYGLRMFLAITLAGALWFITKWPNGSQFILFISVVCSLLSLVDYAPQLGFPFLKSATFCAIMAYLETFFFFQRGEGFLVLALMLGLFLLPAAYAYRHPRLLGGAVVSMLIFYGLSNPANQMNFDITAFLNNGVALLVATACGFFAFHAVPSFGPNARRYWLLRAVRSELAGAGKLSPKNSRIEPLDPANSVLPNRQDAGTISPSPTSGGEGRGARASRHTHHSYFKVHGEGRGEVPGESDLLSEQGWTSRMFDRLRLLHRAGGELPDVLEAENEMLVSLQLGLRQRRLVALLKRGALSQEDEHVVAGVVQQFRELSRHPGLVAMFLRSACIGLGEAVGKRNECKDSAGLLAEMWEMTLLLETSTRLYYS